MKIAVVTDDKQTISAHFGRALFYEIFTVKDGRIQEQQFVHKTNHHNIRPDEPHEPHEPGHSHNHDHASMLEPIMGCNVLITRGMGMGAYNALKLRGIEVIITDIRDILGAVDVYLAGVMVNHLERLH